MALHQGFKCARKFALPPLRDVIGLQKHRNFTLSATNNKIIVDFERKLSPVGGNGNFARDHIPAGTKVWAFDSEACQVFYPDTIGKLSPSLLPEILWKCFLTKDLKKMIVLEDGAEFTNHGGSGANIKFGEDDESWVAVKDIAAGEEMMFDYDTFGANIDADWVRTLCEEHCPRAIEFEKARRVAAV